MPYRKQKGLLEKLLALGTEGMEMDKIKDDHQKKELRQLIKLEYVISLDGNILYHRDVYNDLTEKIMNS
jgi:hypothetical protein